MTKQFQTICGNLNVKYVRIPQSIHTNLAEFKGWNSVRVSNALNYSYQHSGKNYNGIVAIIASDIFLTKEFSIQDYMKNSEIAGFYQERGHVKYIWDHIVFFKMNNLINKEQIDFGCGYVENNLTDCGGKMHYYLKNHPRYKIKYFDRIYLFKSNINFPTSFDGSDRVSSIEGSQENLEKNGFNKKDIDFIFSIFRKNETQFALNNTFLHYKNGSLYAGDENTHIDKTFALYNFIDSLLND